MLAERSANLTDVGKFVEAVSEVETRRIKSLMDLLAKFVECPFRWDGIYSMYASYPLFGCL